jgi:hypothetical protein
LVLRDQLWRVVVVRAWVLESAEAKDYGIDSAGLKEKLVFEASPF